MLFLHYQIIRYNITWLEHRKRTLFYRERRHQYLSQRPRHCRPGPGIQISPTLCVLICPLAWNTADCAHKFSLPLRTWEVRRQRWDVFGFPRGDLTYPEDLSVRGRRRQLLMLPWEPRAVAGQTPDIPAARQMSALVTLSSSRPGGMSTL